MGGFGDYYGKTNLHPLGFTAALVLGIALVLLPRRFAIFPIVLLGAFIPSAQRLVVMGADFDLLRILVLFGWTRILVRNEMRGLRWNRLDALMIAWMICGVAVFALQNGTVSAFVNRCGWALDGLGMYFLFRCLVQDWQDLERLALCFIIVSIPCAVAFLIENQTGLNAFSFLGGVPAVTLVREGKLRCQGAFSHPIMAGCFWAGVLPWMFARFWHGNKLLTALGLGCATLIVALTSSSTPISAVIFGIIGLSFFFVRQYMRFVRWGLFCSLVLLHFVMKNPVWHLLARIDFVGGSTGWHRFKIMDATINNFSKWWRLGEIDPSSWGVWQMRDITNQYIIIALEGGLLTLMLYIATIAVAFGIVGKSMPLSEFDPVRRMTVWCVGVSLFVHVCGYFGVSYFGQTSVVWFLNLAIIGSLAEMVARLAERATALASISHDNKDLDSTHRGVLGATPLGESR